MRACLSVACDRLSWLPVTELAGSCLLFSIMAIHPLSGSGCEHGQEADRVYDEVRRCQPTQQEFQLSDNMMHRHVSTSVGSALDTIHRVDYFTQTGSGLTTQRNRQNAD